MKVLSLLQPWASLWVAGAAADAKGIETRSWGTSYRGRVAVHASKRFDIDQKHLCQTEPFASVLTALGHKTIGDIPLGVLLGWVTVTEVRKMVGFHGPDRRMCVHYAADYVPAAICICGCDARLTPNERAFGNYEDGRFAWITSKDRLVLADPIPLRGQLGLRDLPADLEARLA